MISPTLYESVAGDFPYVIREFNPATDYEDCVALIRLSMHSIKLGAPGFEAIAPSGMEDEVQRILTSDMQPGEAGIPAHYTRAPRSAFWVAVATRPGDPDAVLPGTEYPFVAGMLALRPSRVCAPEYATLCAERGFDIDKEATLNRMVTSPKARRRGLGEALLKVSEAMAGANGYNALHLATASNGKAAVGLYLKTGFTILREITFSMQIPVPNPATNEPDLIKIDSTILEMRKPISH